MREGISWLVLALTCLTTAVSISLLMAIRWGGVAIHRRIEFNPKGESPRVKPSNGYSGIACGPEYAEGAVFDDDALTVKIHPGSRGRRTPAAIILVDAAKAAVPHNYGYYLRPIELSADKLTVEVVHYEGEYSLECHDGHCSWPVEWLSCERDAWIGQGTEAKCCSLRSQLASYMTVKNTYVIPKSDFPIATVGKLRNGKITVLVAFWSGARDLPAELDKLFPVQTQNLRPAI